MTMKILIADDHGLFRDGLRTCLEKIYPDAVILESATYKQSLENLKKNKFDFIILDLTMPDMAWEEGLDELTAKSDGAKFVIISASEEPHDIRKALGKGAVGYIPKRVDTNILAGALKFILEGGTYIPPSLVKNSNTKEDAKSNGKLTKRQSQVLELIAKGESNKIIAYELGVSEATVKLHVNTLFKSLNATNRTQAVIIAQEKGLI